MYQSTITLFNYHADTKNWYSTVFTGADLIESSGTRSTQQGEANSDVVDLLIHVRSSKKADTVIYEPNRITDGQGNIIVSDADSSIIYDDPNLHLEKQYIGPKAYATLKDPQGYFTFTPEADFFIVGNYYSSEPISDDEFEDGLYSAMNAVRDGVYMVSSAAFYGLLPHFEIGGK